MEIIFVIKFGVPIFNNITSTAVRFLLVRFFYVLLTVHLSIILAIDQLNEQILVL